MVNICHCVKKKAVDYSKLCKSCQNCFDTWEHCLHNGSPPDQIVREGGSNVRITEYLQNHEKLRIELQQARRTQTNDISRLEEMDQKLSEYVDCNNEYLAIASQLVFLRAYNPVERLFVIRIAENKGYINNLDFTPTQHGDWSICSINLAMYDLATLIRYLVSSQGVKSTSTFQLAGSQSLIIDSENNKYPLFINSYWLLWYINSSRFNMALQLLLKEYITLRTQALETAARIGLDQQFLNEPFTVEPPNMIDHSVLEYEGKDDDAWQQLMRKFLVNVKWLVALLYIHD